MRSLPLPSSWQVELRLRGRRLGLGIVLLLLGMLAIPAAQAAVYWCTK